MERYGQDLLHLPRIPDLSGSVPQESDDREIEAERAEEEADARTETDAEIVDGEAYAQDAYDG